MPDLIDHLGTFGTSAAKSLFRYRATGPGGSRSTLPRWGGNTSPSNSAWLYNLPFSLLRGDNPRPRVTTSADLTGSSLFVIALNRQIIDFCSAPPVVEQWEKPDGRKPRWVSNYEHDANRLLHYPNEAMTTGSLLFAGVLCDLKFDANSYIAKQRNVLGEVIALHWAPWMQWRMALTEEDAAAGKTLSYYERSGPAGVERYAPDDVIHIRDWKPDPADQRRGWNDSAAFFTEAMTDMERAAFTLYFLSNRAEHGGILGPDGDDVEWDEDTAAKIGAQFQANTGGSNVGKIHVATTPFKFTPSTFSPEQMVLDALSRVPETRLAGWFNYPPSVLNFLAGADSVNHATLEKSAEMALEAACIPLWRHVGTQLAAQLLSEPQFGHRRRRGTSEDGTPLYAPMPTAVRVGFDTLEVRALQPDLWKAREAAREDFKAGGLTLNGYRAEIGQPPDTSGRGEWYQSDFLWMAQTKLSQNANGDVPDRDAAAVLDDANPQRLRATPGGLNGSTAEMAMSNGKAR